MSPTNLSALAEKQLALWKPSQLDVGRTPMAPLPRGPFHCVFADPPWLFKDTGTRLAPKLSKNGYATMPLEDIQRMGVADISAKNSHLWLCCPEALLKTHGWPTCEAWGFRNIIMMVKWVKARRLSLQELLQQLHFPKEWRDADVVNGKHGVVTLRDVLKLAELPKGLQHANILGPLQLGGGHYLRHASEVAILAVRGRLTARRRDQLDVVFASKSIHSAKPDELFERIEKVSPGPRVELFAGKSRINWVSWGDQVDKRGKKETR